MKVFVIAFACEPNRTSEPGVGWNLVGELAKSHELTVLTRKNNQTSIAEYVRDNPESSWARIRWEYYDLAEWFHRMKKHIPCGVQLYQEIWQWRVSKRFLHEFSKYDVVHHLTFGSIFFTPWAARYADKFVWGPIGGAAGAMEVAFLKNESFRSRISEAFYRLVAWYSFHPAPWAKACRKACRAILYRTSELASRAPTYANQVVAVRGESAYPGEIRRRAYNQQQHSLRIASVGRLIPLKGYRYTIEAFAAFLRAGGKGLLDIFGTGPLMKELRIHAKRLGVEDLVTFHGNVPNAEVLNTLDSADVLVHSSFREGVSWTILEAMAHGVPVICQDRAGMKDVVAHNCGVRIAAASPHELITQMAEALLDFYQHPERVRELGEAGQARIKAEYQWSRIADAINQQYSEVCNG